LRRHPKPSLTHRRLAIRSIPAKPPPPSRCLLPSKHPASSHPRVGARHGGRVCLPRSRDAPHLGGGEAARGSRLQQSPHGWP
jgi:hypothetical protein